MSNLRKTIKYLLIILLFLNCYGDRNPNIPIEIIKCPGEYDGHLQGIAIDDNQNFIYWSFTKQIVKTDISGLHLTAVAHDKMVTDGKYSKEGRGGMLHGFGRGVLGV